MNYERMDRILARLENIQYEVQQAEKQWGPIVPVDQWASLYRQIHKLIDEDRRAQIAASSEPEPTT